MTLKIYYTKELAAELKLSSRTLEKWRRTGEGPKFAKLGKLVYYQEEDVVEWLTQRTKTTTPAGQRYKRP